MSHVFCVQFDHKYYHRKNTKVIQGPKAKTSEPKKAKLLARKTERVSLSSYIDKFGVAYPIADFLNHPMGIASMLNTGALQRYEQLTPNTYRSFSSLSGCHGIMLCRNYCTLQTFPRPGFLLCFSSCHIAFLKFLLLLLFQKNRVSKCLRPLIIMCFLELLPIGFSWTASENFSVIYFTRWSL